MKYHKIKYFFIYLKSIIFIGNEKNDNYIKHISVIILIVKIL